MKRIKQTVSIFLALAVSLLATGCNSADMSWSYKDDITTVSIGTYIYYSYNAFNQAANKVDDSNGDFLSEEIKDDDGNKLTAREFINREADLGCKTYITVDKIMQEMGLTLTDEEVKIAESNASNYWSYIKDSMESYGVSKDSYIAASSLLNSKYDKIFTTLYGAGGDEEVPVSEISDYFLKNYTNYSYFSVPLYTDNSTDAESAEMAASSSTPLSKEEINAIKANLDKYANSINKDGDSYENAVKAYMADYTAVTEDPSVTNTAVLSKSGIAEDLITAYDAMKEGEAKVIKIGDDDSTAMYYFLYKGKIADKEKEFTSNEDYMFQVISAMKSEEFLANIDKRAETIECEINQPALDKYTADKFITYVEPTEAASSEETNNE